MQEIIIIWVIDYESNKNESNNEFYKVRSYIRDFQHAIEKQNIPMILQYYETDWNKMTERYYKSSPWPHWSNIEHIVGQDNVFILLYKGSNIFGSVCTYFRTLRIVLSSRVHVAKWSVASRPGRFVRELLRMVQFYH